MKLSSKGDYAIRALVDLAQNQGRGPIPSAAIAKRKAIPESLIGQVLASLRLAGFVRSARGAQGGHELARNPELIRLDAVVQSLEGPLGPVECLGDPAACGKSANCGQRQMWDDVRRAITEVLSSRTVADLAEAEVAAGGRYVI